MSTETGASYSRIAVPGGGTWPPPDAESAESHSLSWMLRYAPSALSRMDQIVLAEIVDAYGFMVLHTTRDQRDRAVRAIREAVTDSAQTTNQQNRSE